MSSVTQEFKFENGALRLHQQKNIDLFEGELKRNPALRQAVYNSAEQQQQDIAAKYAEKAKAERAISTGASGSNMELGPAQQAELALRNQQANGGLTNQGPSILDRVETT